MKHLLNLLISTRTMGTLLILFALAMAFATFVENDYGTPVAKVFVYDSWWFELIMLLLIVNFIYNIKRYRLWKRGKWSVLAFHLAFILIFIGGAVTRYISFEGVMHIREGEESDVVISEDNFFKVQITNGEEALAYDDVQVTLLPEDIPAVFKPFRQTYDATYNFMGQHVTMRVLNYLPRAQDSLLAGGGQEEVLKFVVLVDGQRQNKFLRSGSVQLIENVLVSFNQYTEGAINITEDAGALHISSPVDGAYMVMATEEKGLLRAEDEMQDLQLRALYTLGETTFVVPELPQKGKLMFYEGDPVKNEHDPDRVTIELRSGEAIDTVAFYGGKGMSGFQHQSDIAGLTVTLGYGAKLYTTPFKLKLDRFEMERYPGSNSPSAYSSHVSILKGGEQRSHHIYMNNILDQDGYRFFQSGFDPDEKGTILSVNHDFWGTTLTYIGYFLLFGGMLATLFWKGSRFTELSGKLKQLAVRKTYVLLGAVLLSAGQLKAQDQITPMPYARDAAKLADSIKIDKAHAKAFGSLLVQNIEGRVEPVNTLALEILRKLHGKDHFYQINADQFLLSATTDPFAWAQVPFIKVGTRGGEELLTAVKANGQHYTSMLNLLQLDANGQPAFRLAAAYAKAFAKKPAEQNNYDKELIELNDKLEAMQFLLSGRYLRVLPLPGDSNNTWVAGHSHEQAHEHGEEEPPAEADDELWANYLKSVIYAEQSGSWTEAGSQLEKLKTIQIGQSASIIPARAKIDLELWYNGANLFFKLMIIYTLLGSALLVVAFLRLFSTKKLWKNTATFFLACMILAAAFQAAGLGIRWYISGHAPWSNGYEAVMFISWIGVVSGLALYRNSNSFIPAAGCLVAVILMGFAHGGSQMNPQITPLVPVLKSYWLMVHVAIITSSYGFFGLSALIGAFCLVLYIVDQKKIRKSVRASIEELTIVNELSLTVGLFMLTIGTFLGGMWANESWGRYWSWDPKETWAFISVIVYAFTMHLRLIPGARSKFLFNFMSLVSFASIIMTYFGVNYYLSGLHSYAKGDPVPIPSWIYVTTASVVLLGLISYSAFKRKNSY